MNIAVAADGQNLNSEVSEQFDSCNYLLYIKNPEGTDECTGHHHKH